MKRLFIAVLALFSLTAFASPGNDGCVGNCSSNGQNPNVSVDTRNNALAYVNNKTDVAVTVQPAPVQQAAPQALTVNNNLPAQPEQRSTVNVRTVPNVFSGNVYPTAPCMGSSTVGAAALGWGVSAGTSWADHECGKRETARSFQNLGLTNDAVAVLCSSEYAAVAPICQAREK